MSKFKLKLLILHLFEVNKQAKVEKSLYNHLFLFLPFAKTLL